MLELRTGGGDQMSETRGKMKEGGFRLFVAMAVMMVAFAGLVTFQAFGADESDAADESYEASVVSNGVETKYATLEGAFGDAVDGDKIVLLKAVTGVDVIIVNGGKTIDFDLNGFKMEFGTTSGFKLEDAGLDIIGKGTITFAEDLTSSTVAIRVMGSNESGTSNYTMLSVGPGVTIIGNYGVIVTPVNIDGNSNAIQDGIVIDIYGTVIAYGPGAALFVNGQLKNQETSAPKITVHDGASVIGRGTNGNVAMGIYAAGYAQWNLEGGYVEGNSGIEIRAGVLNITDAVIVATEIPTTVTPNGNGSTTDGAGIAVAQHTTKLNIQVTINGGSISGYTALNIVNPQKNSDSDIAKVSVEVNGGTFACNNGGKVAVGSIDQITGFINGGTFSSDVSAYVASGVSIVQKGAIWYVGDDSSSSTTEAVVDGEVVVDNPESTTASFIVTEAQPKATIKTSLSGISMTVNVTDLAQGSYEFIVEKVEKPVVGTNVIRIETPNVTISSIAISVPIEVPSGHYVSSDYYNEATGEREYLSGVSYSGGMLSFSTNHNSYYGYEYTTSTVVYDDDDYYPIVPVTPASTSSNDDDTKTIVACAAAAVAAALAVAFFLVDSRRP